MYLKLSIGMIFQTVEENVMQNFFIFPKIETGYFKRIIICNPDLYNECNRITRMRGLSIDVVIDASYFFI